MRAVTDDGVAIRCLYPPDHERAAALEIEASRFGLAHLGAAFGRYPYRTLTIVHPPTGADEAGGMEYPTLITTGGSWLVGGAFGRFVEAVTLHELAHQWFYGLVATNEHRYPFLDEGLTSYAEADVLRARHGAASAARVLGLELDILAIYRAGAIEAGHNAVIGQAAPDFVQGSDYGALVYGRMATLVSTLEGVYGRDLIRGAVGRYAREGRFRHPGPEALLAAVREDAGDGAAEALRLAVFERGWVDYAVAGMESYAGGGEGPAQGGADGGAAVYRGHAFVRRRGTLVLPVDVDLHGADGAVQRVRWDAREPAARLPYAGASRLVAVVIDPERRVLLDEDLTNNAAREGRQVLAPRVLHGASLAAGVLLTLLGP
jgi:Peptidase family M1 domain